MGYRFNTVARRLLSFGVGSGLLAFGAWDILGWAQAIPKVPLTLPVVLILIDPWAAAMLPSLLGGVLALLGGAALILLALSRDREDAERSGDWVVLIDGREQGFGGARVSLAKASLEALVVHAAMGVAGVRSVRPRLSRTPDGWSLRCDVEVWTDRPAVEIGAELEREIPEWVRAHTGVPVSQIDIDLHYAAAQAARVA